MIDIIDTARNVLEEEALKEGEHNWPDRCCMSLVLAVCAAFKTDSTAAVPFVKLPYERAVAKAIKEHGSLGNAYQQLLIAQGWKEIPVTDSVQPCDIISYNGRVHFADGSIYDPPVPGADWIGFVGPDCYSYGWGQHGLTMVDNGIHVRTTRCRS